jgi:hypothetical protein
MLKVLADALAFPVVLIPTSTNIESGREREIHGESDPVSSKGPIAGETAGT